ncbi:hypothetical protein E6O75_ATG02137 [Venturia nashicola]|uniref:Uncharacterized protein n=1 Tax=Venturia nashicola TaxID=86259 RepID=A0A4Z1P2M3_9PEZI|nr:hypothetical protein E6O75_ATG02137 [Venturia nashicola]
MKPGPQVVTVENDAVVRGISGFVSIGVGSWSATAVESTPMSMSGIHIPLDEPTHWKDLGSPVPRWHVSLDEIHIALDSG